MEKKQSSVELLINFIRENIDYIPILKHGETNDLIQQAKEMHREEIEEAFNQGYRDAEIDCFEKSDDDVSNYENANQYYNKTYKR